MSSLRGTFSGLVDPNFPPPGASGGGGSGGGKWDTSVIIYGYTPSIALAALGAALFFVLFVTHTIQVIRHRSWYFIPFPVGLLFEIVGYIARSLSAAKNPYNLIYFILNYFFIVTAPVFLAAGIYTILSALIHRCCDGRLGRSPSQTQTQTQSRAPLAPKLVLWFFITSDVIATMTQISGAALIGVRQSRREDPTTANNILLGGLAYQVFSMGCFVITTAVFLFRARRGLGEMMGEEEGGGRRRLMDFVAAFSVATVLVYLRTCFRLAETAEGLGGKLYTNEVFFGVLEFAPVVWAVILFAVWHPGRCVGSKVSGDLGAGEVEKREARIRSLESVQK